MADPKEARHACLEAATRGEGVRSVQRPGGRRVSLEEPGRASVVSSNGDKTYTVEWTGDLESLTANDNASYWQGYMGYPVIAVLIATGKVDAGEAATAPLAGVGWHELNARFKRDYDAAVDEVLRRVASAGGDAELVRREAGRVMQQLAGLTLERPGRGRRRPPRG